MFGEHLHTAAIVSKMILQEKASLCIANKFDRPIARSLRVGVTPGIWDELAQKLTEVKVMAEPSDKKDASQPPPKVNNVSYHQKSGNFYVSMKVDGKSQNGPQRQTQAAAIADRDKILQLRASGTSAEVRLSRCMPVWELFTRKSTHFWSVQNI